MSVPVDMTKRFQAAGDRYVSAANAVTFAFQDLDRNDKRVSALLRQRYGIPQRMEELFNSISEFVAAAKPIMEIADRS